MRELHISLQLQELPTRDQLLKNLGFLMSVGQTFESLAIWLEMELGRDVTGMEDEPLLTDINYYSGMEDDFPMSIVISSPVLDSYELTDYLQALIREQLKDLIATSPLPLMLLFEIID